MRARIVSKRWGHEVWLVNTPLYCLKRLVISPSWQCSLHRHLVKDETFVVVSGTCILELGTHYHVMSKGDSIRISPKRWHRFINESESTFCEILEVSTHHSEKDVERREPSKEVR